MDIKFDTVAAEQLILQMDKYCLGIQKETRELLDILKSSGEWKDNQRKAFQENVTEIAKDLNRVLALEGDYMRTFHQRVMELRG